MYSALSHPPNKFEGHKPRLDIYRKPSPPKDGIFKFTSEFDGMIRQKDGSFKSTNKFQIGYTQWGDRGPVVLLLHGVPTNRLAKLPIQELLSPFCRTIAIDMLGMGGEETSKPQLYGQNKQMSVYDGTPDDPKAWDWINDCSYIKKLMMTIYPGERFFFQADDWGGGILSHYIDLYPNDLLGAIWVDPIAFDGYPVSEIQAFGRAAMIPRENVLDENGEIVEGMDDILFKQLLGSADQTMVQIFKTMVFDPNKYNQYNLRNIKKGYVDTDYERSKWKDGEDATSLTLRLKYDNMRTLCERAAVLSPSLLFPYDKNKNPKGVDYSKYKGKALVIWGGQDNMMPENQKWRFKNVLYNASVEINTIDNAGHFVETDQPERVAEAMISFMTNVVGINGLADVCLGFGRIWKGDEREMIKDLRNLLK